MGFLLAKISSKHWMSLTCSFLSFLSGLRDWRGESKSGIWSGGWDIVCLLLASFSFSFSRARANKWILIKILKRLHLLKIPQAIEIFKLFLKRMIFHSKKNKTIHSPSMLRLVSRFPVRLRSNCGAGRSTGVFLVWYMVRPEYRNLEPNLGKIPLSFVSGVISRKNVWCSTHAFHSFLAARWLANLKPIVDSYCSNSPGRILM